MPAYVIVDVTVTDPVLYEQYKKLTPGSIAPYGGKFIVRGGATETLEGDWHPQRIVVLEFPDMENAKTWYNSDAYRAAREIRWNASTGRILLVEGFDG
ncbi:MAG: DUF1330 domain-containing protein [Cyclobacteriaceae bacterium]|nr:DUF1330 domain-containing protein [Cyclobacteriaceae bacterium]